MTEVKPIRTEEDLANAIQLIQRLSKATPGTPEHDDREILSALIEQFRSKNQHIALPNPIAAIESHMEQHGNDST